jgi:hypothetical protein
VPRNSNRIERLSRRFRCVAGKIFSRLFPSDRVLLDRGYEAPSRSRHGARPGPSLMTAPGEVELWQCSYVKCSAQVPLTHHYGRALSRQPGATRPSDGQTPATPTRASNINRASVSANAERSLASISRRRFAGCVDDTTERGCEYCVDAPGIAPPESSSVSDLDN